MGAEEGGFDFHRAERPELSGDAEHFHLCFDVQTVARLDFDGGDAFGQERFESTQCRFEKLRF